MIEVDAAGEILALKVSDQISTYSVIEGFAL